MSQRVSTSFPFRMRTTFGPLPYNRLHEVGLILHSGIIVVCRIES